MGSYFGFDSSINLRSLQTMDNIEEILDFIDEGLIEIENINLIPTELDDDNNNFNAENNGK